jgi:hypothetical protein
MNFNSSKGVHLEEGGFWWGFLLEHLTSDTLILRMDENTEMHKGYMVFDYFKEAAQEKRSF